MSDRVASLEAVSSYVPWTGFDNSPHPKPSPQSLPGVSCYQWESFFCPACDLAQHHNGCSVLHSMPALISMSEFREHSCSWVSGTVPLIALQPLSDDRTQCVSIDRPLSMLSPTECPIMSYRGQAAQNLPRRFQLLFCCGRC